MTAFAEGACPGLPVPNQRFVALNIDLLTAFLFDTY